MGDLVKLLQGLDADGKAGDSWSKKLGRTLGALADDPSLSDPESSLADLLRALQALLGGRASSDLDPESQALADSLLEELDRHRRRRLTRLAACLPRTRPLPTYFVSLGLCWTLPLTFLHPGWI